MSRADAPLLEHLAASSERYRDPLSALDWSRLDTRDWWLPPAALTLYGLPEYETLAERVRVRLSQYEFLNMTLMALWLEGVFLARLSEALAGRAFGAHRYLLHEIREEAGHSLMFHKLIEASGLDLEPGDWERPAFADFIGRHAPADGALFWLGALVAEDVPDKFNRYLRRHGGDGVNPLVQQMTALHMTDEARHIAFARSQLERRLSGAGPFRRALLVPLARRAARQFIDRYFFPPARFYERAGLTRGAQWRALARASRPRREFVRRCIAPTLRMFEGYGIPLAAD